MRYTSFVLCSGSLLFANFPVTHGRKWFIIKRKTPTIQDGIWCKRTFPRTLSEMQWVYRIWVVEERCSVCILRLSPDQTCWAWRAGATTNQDRSLSGEWGQTGLIESRGSGRSQDWYVNSIAFISISAYPFVPKHCPDCIDSRVCLVLGTGPGSVRSH